MSRTMEVLLAEDQHLCGIHYLKVVVGDRSFTIIAVSTDKIIIRASGTMSIIPEATNQVSLVLEEV